MQTLLQWIGSLAGIAGTLGSLVAIAARMTGNYAVMGFPAVALLQGATALMLIGCLCLLAVLTRRR